MPQSTPGQKNSHQEMIGANGSVTRGAFAMSQSHRQAHGALGLWISTQAARDRTIGRGGAFVDCFANSRSIDREGAQRAGGETIGIGHQSKQQMLLAQIRVAVTPRFGVGLFESHSRGGSEVVDEPHSALGRLSGIAPGAGLAFGLFLEPFHQPGLGNKPFSA